jgi:hypothetical protein
MRQKPCRRLEELEKISAAAAARKVETSSDYEETIARIREQAEAWHANPENQKWLAEQPPDYLYRSVQSLRRQLEERANGHLQSAHSGGLR